MPLAHDQILTVAQMREAEQALIDAGSSVEALMQIAGRGAAEWVWRIAAHGPVTVVCGPGNNGGDGYVLAEAIRQRGGAVAVIGALEPKTEAAKASRRLYGGAFLDPEAPCHGEVLVDCLFGSGLTRPLGQAHVELLARLAVSHRLRVAIDLPSGVASDTGALLNEGLPRFDLTLALGAWKFAHFLMPSSANLGEVRLVPIGVAPIEGAAQVIARSALRAPAADSHKYRRGLLAIVGGAMPGAAVLAALAAQGSGAGYVKLLAGDGACPSPLPDLVTDHRTLPDALTDPRIAALLIGPGLGRDDAARARLATALAAPAPLVIDADALMLVRPDQIAGRAAPAIATPHEGELAALERAFGLAATGPKPERALALARTSGMIVVAKGPDTVVAAPDGRLACAGRASTWLSTAGTGDVLAGVIASRLATGAEPFAAACEGVWLHGEAARLCPPAFTAAQLAAAVPIALVACL
ncbi:MAG: NAD(P)H-hydrate dehydratase [Novosphingobium sp.]